MDSFGLRGHWDVMRGQLKQAYGELTADGVAFEEGKRQELLGRIQRRSGKTRSEAREILAKLDPREIVAG